MRPELQAPLRRHRLLLWGSPFVFLIATIVGLILLQPPPPEPPGASAALRRLNLAPMATVPHGEAPVMNPERVPSVEPVIDDDVAALEARRIATLEAKQKRDAERAREAALRRDDSSTDETLHEKEATTESEDLAMVGTGQLHVISTEGFLRVVVDDVARGLTPVQPFDLPAGKHLVQTIETEFTLAQTLEVIIRPDEKNTLRLEPNYKPSTVRLQGFPAGARIHLDGQSIGEVRSIRLNRNRTFAIDVFMGDDLLQTASVIRGVERGQLLPGQTRTIRFRPSNNDNLPESP